MVNKGTITIDGHDSDAPALNVGMLANNSSGMKNSGIINVNGLNSTGLQVINAGQLNSDGTINVDGEGISSGFRNYGAWVEGARSNVNVSGKINLSGTGAVGVFCQRWRQSYLVRQWCSAIWQQRSDRLLCLWKGLCHS